VIISQNDRVDEPTGLKRIGTLTKNQKGEARKRKSSNGAQRQTFVF